jgi:DNA mismatch repair protein MutL
MPIRQLAPDVAAKIAAGEVVERPASVVKELIENSIDAGATQIRVDLVHGGLQLIRVTDNGCGIAPEELPLALSRHATSKVSQIDDLEQIRSLGFRGEALASIASVADVTLLSRQREAEQGAQISASNGQISDVTVAASPEGTTLTVRNLFSAVPARLKFLKSRNTEVSHCHHLLEQYALAYPEIRFSVSSDGRQIFATPGDGQLASALIAVYGLQVAQQMVPIEGQVRNDEPGYPVVSGYTSRPVCYKSTRQHISFFVNRRWVMSRMLTAAVEEAYHSLLLTGRHPIAVVNIQMDPALLDVNVHPAKTEIRFLKERRVFAAILRAVRAALLEEPQMPQWQSPQTTHDHATVSVDETPEEELREEDLEDDAGEEQTQNTPKKAPASSRFPDDNPWLTVTEEETGTQPPLLSRLWQTHVRTEKQAVGTNNLSKSTEARVQPEQQMAGTEPSEEQQSETVAQKTLPDAPTEPASTDNTVTLNGWQFPSFIARPQTTQPEETTVPSEPATEQDASCQSMPALGQPVDPHQARRLPQLRVIGQLAQSYIVTEGENGMYLIDQHAAHERIILERMIANMQSKQPLSQHMLSPIEIKLAPKELETIEEHIPQLEHIGFILAIADHQTLQVRAIPSVLVKQASVRSVHELLVDLTAEEELGQTEIWEERALANVACKAAIKANYFLTVSEMREMLEQLEQTRAPYSCCHGRPTMVHFSLPALQREFGRR